MSFLSAFGYGYDSSSAAFPWASGEEVPLSPCAIWHQIYEELASLLGLEEASVLTVAWMSLRWTTAIVGCPEQACLP